MTGNSTIGSRAVAGIGIASVTHQTAISTAMAATLKPCADMPSGSGIISTSTNSTGPSNKPTMLRWLDKVTLPVIESTGQLF